MERRTHNEDLYYYEVLGLKKGCTAHQIKKAYHRAALRYHPDKNAAPGAEDMFKTVGKAYGVLRDPEKKEIYDRLGMEGLRSVGCGRPRPATPKDPPAGRTKKDPPRPAGRTKKDPPRPASPTKKDPPTARRKHEGCADQKDRPASRTDHEDPPTGRTDHEDPPTGRTDHKDPPTGRTDHEDPPTDRTDRKDPPTGRAAKRKAPPVKCKALPVSLEDIFSGCTKRIKISRRRLNPPRTSHKILEVPIRPGMKAGTRFTFAGEGDESPGGATDVVVVLEDEPHPTLRRDGSDIVYMAPVTLCQALGCEGPITVNVPLLDGLNGGEYLNVVAGEDDLLRQGMKRRIAGRGLPLPRGPPGQRGDLVVEYEVEFPCEPLSKKRKEAIVQALKPEPPGELI